MNHLVDIVVAKDGQFRYRVADSIVQCRHVGVAQYPLLVLLPLGLWNQVLVETTEAQRVTDINIARFETVAQHAVHQKFVLVGVDAPESVRSFS